MCRYVWINILILFTKGERGCDFSERLFSQYEIYQCFQIFVNKPDPMLSAINSKYFHLWLMDNSWIFTVRVEKMSELELDFKAGAFCINSSTGDVLLHTDDHLLHKYALRQDGSYINQWKRQVPENKDNCRMDSVYLTDAGDVILQNYIYVTRSLLTYHFDQDMKLIDSWEPDGQLIGCLSGPRVVYKVTKGGGHVVVIRSVDGEVLQLEPYKGTTWTDLRDVCEDVKTGKLMVCSGDSSLDTISIFSQDGKSQHILHLLMMCLCSCKQWYKWMLMQHLTCVSLMEVFLFKWNNLCSV